MNRKSSGLGGPGAPAHFTMLDKGEPRWSAFGASFLLNCAWVSLLIVVPMMFPQRLEPVMRYPVSSLATPRTEVPMPPKPPKPPQIVKTQVPPPAPVEPPKIAKLVAPRVSQPKPKPVDVKMPDLKPVFRPADLGGPRPEPKRPREEVKTGMLTTGSAAPATVNRPINQVQTGGFGDPNGLPGKGDPSKRANIAQKGSFDLPGGPGYGNGTGGAKGVRGTVASAGFGNGVAIPPSGGGGNGNGRGGVRAGGFSDASAPVETQKARPAANTAGATQPVEILAKPNPAYTEEARRLRLEGDVLVDVVFLASGQVQVNHVVRGLGHGLDQTALQAAQQIRFKPARRDGQAVDFPATVRIVFQMAY